MNYTDGRVIARLKRKEIALTTIVKVDEFTESVSKNFDYTFTGVSEVYPFNLPSLDKNFKILCIVGSSGSGKSTLLNEFDSSYRREMRKFDDNAIVSNFETPDEACRSLSAVGLNSMPVWCRPRRVLSVGEGFRSDVALNLDSFTIFDEFTSTIDRNVAKSTCRGINRFINDRNLTNIVFCSCHKDYLDFLKPDIVIDLDEECVYDCRGISMGEQLRYGFLGQQPRKTRGEYLGNIII